MIGIVERKLMNNKPDLILANPVKPLPPRETLEGGWGLHKKGVQMKPSPPQADGVSGLNTAPQGAGY